jgi:hypothetical protein
VESEPLPLARALRRRSPYEVVLERRHGRWFLDGRALEDGDLVEVRRLHVPTRDPNCEGLQIEEWYPGIVFDDAQAIELEDPTDAGWSRTGRRQSVDLDVVARSTAEIRRVERTTRPDTPSGEPTA